MLATNLIDGAWLHARPFLTTEFVVMLFMAKLMPVLSVLYAACLQVCAGVGVCVSKGAWRRADILPRPTGTHTGGAEVHSDISLYRWVILARLVDDSRAMGSLWPGSWGSGCLADMVCCVSLLCVLTEYTLQEGHTVWHKHTE